MGYINGNKAIMVRIPTYLDLDTVYPVGSVYTSVNSTSPASLFGGTWELIQNKFLLGTDDLANLGNTGGEATHQLSVDEMPSHRHEQMAEEGNAIRPMTSPAGNIATSFYGPRLNLSASSTDKGIGTDVAGGSQAHNNMPPYIKVAIWKRTA